MGLLTAWILGRGMHGRSYAMPPWAAYATLHGAVLLSIIEFAKLILSRVGFSRIAYGDYYMMLSGIGL